MVETLSSVALLTAAATKLSDRRIVAEFLYAFNCRPRSVAKCVDCPSLGGQSSYWWALEALRPDYDSVDVATWRYWTAQANDSSRHQNSLRSKLYISIASVDPELLSSFSEICRALKPPQFKVAISSEQISRPDHWVVYFAEHASLVQFADAISNAVASHPQWGVPFTIRWAQSAGVSWAEDPYSPTDAQHRHSFRGMIVGQLSDVIVDAVVNGADAERALALALSFAEAKGYRPNEWV